QISLEQQIHDGHEAGDHHDVAGDTDLVGDDLAQQGDDDVGQGQDDQNGKTHADTVEEGGGDGHGGTHAQQLHGNGVLSDETLFELLFDIHIGPSLTHGRGRFQRRGDAGTDSTGGNGSAGEGVDGAVILGDLHVAGRALELLAPGGVGGVGAQAGG